MTALYLFKEHPEVEKGEKILGTSTFFWKAPGGMCLQRGGENRRLNPLDRIVPSLENSSNEVH
jgi:hypothetical protein